MRYLAFACCLFIFSCASESNSGLEEEDLAYRFYQLEKRGWKSRQLTKTAQDIQYRASEVPLEYYLLQNEGIANLSNIDSLSKKHAHERIIEFELEHAQQEDLLQAKHTTLNYEESVQYLSSTIRNDFVAVTASNDTIPCAGVHFERHFQVSPFKRVLLYFGGIESQEAIQLIYRDRLYKNGIFKFKFNEIPFKT